jgi:hypothetical protein
MRVVGGVRLYEGWMQWGLSPAVRLQLSLWSSGTPNPHTGNDVTCWDQCIHYQVTGNRGEKCENLGGVRVS